MASKKIFMSYCWMDESYANFVDDSFQQVGIKLIRDKRDLKYGSSIKAFANKARQSSYIICLISDEFLRRENCMYEIMVSMQDTNFKKKFCPIVINYDNDSKVDLTSEGIEKYATYWKNECDKMNTLINNQTDNVSKMEHIAVLKKYEDVYRNIRDFLYTLKDTIFILNSKIDTDGIKAIGENLFMKIGINPKINMEHLLEIAQQGNIESSERMLSDYLKEHLIKENEYYFYTRANVYEKFCYYELAFFNYKLAAEINPKFILAYESMLRMYIKGIIPIDEHLLYIVNDLEGRDSGNATILSAKGMLEFKNGKYKKSIHLFEDALTNVKPQDLCYIYNNLGNAYEKLYENDTTDDYLTEAKNFYEKSIESNNEYYQVYNNLAILLLKEKKLKEALQAVNRCLELNPSYHHGLNTLGLIQDEFGDYYNAIISYSKAYQQKSDYMSPLSNIAYNLDYIFKNELCGVYYSLVYNKCPNNLIYIFNYGNYYRKYTNDKTKALELLREAYQISPSNLLCNMALGLFFYGEKEYEKAKKYFAYATVLEPTCEQAKFCLLVCELFLTKDKADTLSKLNSLCLKSEYYPITCLREVLLRSGKIEDIDLKELFNIIENDYVKVRGQISKTSHLTPHFSLDNAYKYIVDNFYMLN